MSVQRTSGTAFLWGVNSGLVMRVVGELCTEVEGQTVFFSATISPPIQALVRRHSRDAKTVKIEQRVVAAELDLPERGPGGPRQSGQ